MIFELKPLTQEAIPKALEKAERYRLLKEPAQAESICLDVLQIDPGNQQALVMRKLDAAASEIRFNTLRGFYCKVQSTTDLTVPFADELGGATLALDSSITLTNTITGSQKFYRAAMSSAP